MSSKKDKFYIAKQLNRLLQLSVQKITLSDEEKLEVAELYPLWEPNKNYKAKDIIKYGWNDDGESQLYEILLDHVSQIEWIPGDAPSLYKKIGFTPSGYPIWTQPVGSTDAYMKDDIVVFEQDGVTYQSTVDNNVWAPNVYGWVVYSD